MFDDIIGKRYRKLIVRIWQGGKVSSEGESEVIWDRKVMTDHLNSEPRVKEFQICDDKDPITVDVIWDD